jgi:hypothetical protein
VRNIPNDRIAELERENSALRNELDEQARLNGKGSEREAALLAKMEKLERRTKGAVVNLDLNMRNVERCTTHHYACACREHKFATLEKENLRLRLEQAKFRTALTNIVDAKPGNDYSTFARKTAARAIGRRKR